MPSSTTPWWATTSRCPSPSGRSSSPWVGAGGPDRIAAAAALTAAIHDRTGPFAKLIREAAATDEEIAEVLRATRERQRQDIGAGFELILGRPPTDAERDGAWAILSPEVYLLLVEQSGWSLAQYETWLSTMLASVLPRS